jgi:hypothetical protein
VPSESASHTEVAATDTSPAHRRNGKKPAKIIAADSKPPSALDVLNPWWKGSGSSFDVAAVGSASEQPGIVVVFSNDLKDPASAAQLLRLTHNGQVVPGTWQSGTNNRVLVHHDLQPGRYQLSIDGAVASASAQTLGTSRIGPVFVR